MTEEILYIHNPQEVLIYSGLQGSGKTTLVQQWLCEAPDERERINYDDLRLALFGPSWKWNRRDEEKMKQVATKRAAEALHLGKSIAIDNTNLTDGARRKWFDLAMSFGIQAEQVEVDTTVATCVERDSKREGRARVGRALIERNALFHGFIDWADAAQYSRDFIIVDMDGTLADCSLRRTYLDIPCPYTSCQNPACKTKGTGLSLYEPHPTFELDESSKCTTCGCKMPWKRKDHKKFYEGVENDPPIQPILKLVAFLHDIYDIIIVSGRPLDLAGRGTEEWLEKNLRDGWVGALPIKHLFMRNQGDFRPDFEVKQEILDLLPKDRIKYVLDDRDQVVEMWRRNGLTCLQVADGKF